MKLKKLAVACALTCTAAFPVSNTPHAQTPGDIIRFGFINDRTGLYSRIVGPGRAPNPKKGAERGGGKAEVLSNNDEGLALGAQHLDHFGQFLHDDGRQAFGNLVQ